MYTLKISEQTKIVGLLAIATLAYGIGVTISYHEGKKQGKRDLIKKLKEDLAFLIKEGDKVFWSDIA